MQCAEIKSQLEALGEAQPLPQAVAGHLQQCLECQAFSEDLNLQRLLRTLPLREAQADFDKRVLRAAFDAQPDTRVVGTRMARAMLEKSPLGLMAMAASLVLAVLVGLQWQQTETVATPQVVAAPLPGQTEQLEPVQVMLNSDRVLQNVSVTVDLPSHLALEGYGDKQRLQWTSTLNVGANKLVLPVQLREQVIGAMADGDLANGEIVIELEHEGLRKQFRVPVQRAARNTFVPQAIYTS